MHNTSKNLSKISLINKIGFVVGLLLCGIGILLFIPFYRELVQYKDYPDSKALVLMICANLIAGSVVIHLSSKK
jgi:hypothetical protein